MQFTGHSLLVHQPSTPARFLSIIGHWDVSHPLFLELQVWSSSSGNNYHAVHRSISSGASLFLRHSENFYLVSYCEPSCILHSLYPRRVTLEQNYWNITLTLIVAKIYNTLLLNCIEPEIEKILRKNQNGFQRDWPMTSQILNICWKLEGIISRLLQGILLHTQRKVGANTSGLQSPQRNHRSHNDAL